MKISTIFLVLLLAGTIQAKNERRTDKVAVEPLSAACQARQINTDETTACQNYLGQPLNGPSPFPCACFADDKAGGSFPGTGAQEKPNDFSMGFNDYTIGKNPPNTFASLTAMAFTDNTDEIYVLSKAGQVFRVDMKTEEITTFTDFSDQVHNLGDYGGLSIEVHTNFAQNPYIYVSYVNGSLVGGLEFNTISFVKVLRLTSSNGKMTEKKTILGVTPTDSNVLCASSHAGGALAMGHDGSLFITLGEGAHFDTDVMDFGQVQERYPLSGRCQEFFPGQDMGSLRAQSKDTLGGKLIRVDPENGEGICSGSKFSVYNPFCVPGTDLRSPKNRIWAMGFRNPFSMNVRPKEDNSEAGPGVPYVGDVGLGSFEEVNAVTSSGLNFGWPCWEGPLPMAAYRDSNLNDLSLPNIVRPKDDNGNPFSCPFVYQNVETTAPIYYYSRYTHSMAGLYGEQYVLGAGFTGNCVSGVTFYTGTNYPPQFKDQVFFADYGTQWIKSFTTDGPDTFKAQYDFKALSVPVVSLEINPQNGDVCYLELIGGVIHCLGYNSDPQAPYVVAQVNVTGGVAPLAVGFNTDGTFDPRSSQLSFVVVDFGDGSEYAVGPNPTHVYNASGTYVATVHVSNGNLTNYKTIEIKVGDPVPTAVMTQPSAGREDSFGFFEYTTDNLNFAASAVGGTAPYTYFWDVYMVHTNHYHPQSATYTQANLVATLNEMGAASHVGERINFLLILKVTDANGYTSQTYSRLSPSGWNSEAPIPKLVAAPGPYTTGQFIRFDASGTSDVELDTITYVWNFGDGRTISFDPQQNNRYATHAYSQPGDYVVTLTTVDNWGSKAEVTLNIRVEAGYVQNPPTEAIQKYFRDLAATTVSSAPTTTTGTSVGDSATLINTTPVSSSNVFSASILIIVSAVLAML